MPSDTQPKVASGSFGLSAIGSSGSWEVTLDEPLDNAHGWVVEIEGPHVYVSCSIQDPHVLRDVRDFLQSREATPEGSAASQPRSDELTLGKFGPSRIWLVWDNEDFDRCFLIIGPTGDFTVRWTLLREEIRSLMDAIQAALDQLAQDQ
jgi:hypothetical protein